MKKIIVMMLSLSVVMQFLPIIEVTLSATELKNEEAQVGEYKAGLGEVENPEVDVYGGDIYIEGEEITPTEFDELLEDAEILNMEYNESPRQSRSGSLALAAWGGSSVGLAGIGTIFITAGGVIILLGAVVTAAWIIKKVVAFFAAKLQNVKNGIPSWFKSGNKVRLDLCTYKDNKGRRWCHPKKDKKGDYYIEKDHSEHAGKAWKVKYKNGTRKASVRADGTIVSG